jgi:HEAT repeat protein
MNILQRYINEFKNASVSKKISIIKILATSKKEQVKQILVDCLSDPSPGVRIAALQALEKLNFFNEELLLKLCHDNSKAIRKIALKMLATNPKTEYLKNCNGLLIDSDKTVRLEVLNLLYKIGKESIPLLHRALKDEDELVRTKALQYIQLLDPSEKLAETKETSPPSEIVPEFSQPRILATTAPEKKEETLPYEIKLTKITEKLSAQDTASLDYFLSLLEDKSWTIREFAIKKITELDNIDMSRIYELLKHPIWYVRAAAILIIGLKKDKNIVDLMMPLMKDNNVEVRRAIAEALGKADKADAIMPLQHLLNDKSIMVRREAEKSLNALKKKA